MKTAALALLLLLDAGEASRGLDPAGCGLIKTVAPLGGELYGASFSFEGARLAVGCGQTVRIYDTTSWQELGRLEGHPQQVYSTAFSRDGKTLAAGGFEGTVQLWDVETRRPLRALTGHGTFIAALAFSPDGRSLLTGAMDGTLRVWDLADGGRVKELPARLGGLTDVVFTGGRALTAGLDGRVHVWRTDPWEVERTMELGTGSDSRWFAFAPGGRRVAGLTTEGLVSADVDGRVAPKRIASGVEGALCRPMADGRYVIVGAGPRRVRILDVASGKAAAELVHHAGEITSIAIHPSGRLFVTAGQERHVKVWGRVPGGMASVRPRGFLGVRIQQDAAGGIFLAEVIPNTAAEAAGMKQGDLLRRVGGRAMANPTEATDQIGSFLAGDEVEVVIERAGVERTIKIRLGRRPPEMEQ
ncbi:MAG TPA: PDZ domain-containing protein [Planctomycetota bacterium]